MKLGENDNIEFYTICHDTDTIQFIKLKRMSFATYIFRMNTNNSVAAKIVNHRTTGTGI